MKFEGLLTGQQKCDGYFTTMDEDFIFLWHGKNTDKPDCIGTFLLDSAKVKEIRDKVEADMKERRS